MEKVVYGTLILSCFVWSQLEGREINANMNDDTLIAHILTPESELEFSITDGLAASFWSEWDQYDYIAMNPTNNWMPSTDTFADSDIASLTIKCGYSKKGLYFLYRRTDDTWIAPSNSTDFGADAIEVYVDKKTRGEIGAMPKTEKATPPNWSNALSKTTRQINIWIGADAPDTLIYFYYDTTIGNLLGLGNLGGENVHTFESAKNQYGIGVEVIEISTTERAVEIFMPWAAVGVDTTNILGRDSNRLLAFTGGSNDKDEESELQKSLRWLQYEPWSSGPYSDPDNKKSEQRVEPCGCAENAVNSWGYIYLQNESDNIGSPIAIQVPHTRNNHIPMAVCVKREYFTIRGERISAVKSIKGKATGMVIERRVFQDGTVMVEMKQATSSGM